jgi:hypothetical protein
MVVNSSRQDRHTSVENGHNVHTPLGTRSPNVYRGFSQVSTYQHCLLQLLTLLNTKL